MQLYKQTNFTLQSYINRQTSHFKVRSGQLEHIIYKFPGTFHVLFLLVVPFRRFQCSVIFLKSRKSQSSSPPKTCSDATTKQMTKGLVPYCTVFIVILELVFAIWKVLPSISRIWIIIVLAMGVDIAIWITSFFHRCFSNILLVKTNYLVSS